MRRLTHLLFTLIIIGVVALGCDNLNEPAGPEDEGLSSAAVGPQHAEACDHTVEDGDEIQDAVDAASDSETICVEPGEYEEDVEVNKAVTILGPAPPHSDNPALINGSVSLDEDGSELRLMAITRIDDINQRESPDPFGVRVTASNTVVAYNLVYGFTGEHGGAINGIQVFGTGTETDISNITVRGNTVTGFRNEVIGGVAGIKLQAGLDDVTVTRNKVSDLHSAGWAWGIVLTSSESHPDVPKDVSVTDNAIGSDLNDNSVSFDGSDPAFPGSAFGVDGGASADEVVEFRKNNLLAPNGAESKDEEETLVAECNWWGDRSGPEHEDNPDGEGTRALERGDAEIDFKPWLIGPSPSNACRGS